MNKKNLLYITAHLPSLKVPQAGHKSAYKILRDYSEKYDIYLLCIVNDLENRYISEIDYGFCKEMCFYGVSRFERIIRLLLNPHLPLRVAFRKDKAIINKIRTLKSNIKFDAVHLEFTASMVYIPYVKNCGEIIVSEHDITFQSMYRHYSQRKNIFKTFLYFEYKRFRSWELKNLSCTNTILTHNVKDKEILISEGFKSEKVSVIEPYVNEELSKVKRDRIEKNTLLFWGAMNRVENIDAVQWFFSTIYPLILKKVNLLKIYIVGANPPQDILKLKSEKVIVTGFVDNPLEYFEKAAVAVVPLRLGAGIKIKVLECLKAKMPVVSTSVGAESISNENLYVEDDPVLFAEKVCSLLQSM